MSEESPRNDAPVDPGELRSVMVGKHQDDFSFLVGTLRYGCSVFVARFLSPKIARVRADDAAVDEFVIETPDPATQFGDLFALTRGDPAVIHSSNYSFFLSIFRELSNSVLLLHS
jgi:hypothetical protein